MNDELRRLNHAKQRYLREQNKRYQTGVFVDITSDLNSCEEQGQPRPTRVWRSRDFLVQEFAEEDGWIRMSVNRTELLETGRYRDGITWDELQGVKCAIGFGDWWGVELYPPGRCVVDVANMRHLWLRKEPLDCGWYKKNIV